MIRNHWLTALLALVLATTPLGLDASSAQPPPEANHLDLVATGLSPGDDVEGPGTVHPLLSIDNVAGEAVLIGSDREPPAFYGQVTPTAQSPNRCLGRQTDAPLPPDAVGFGAALVEGNHFDERQSWSFEVLDGRSLSYFSLEVYDYGDNFPQDFGRTSALNPPDAQPGLVLRAYDGDGTLVAETELVDVRGQDLALGDACGTMEVDPTTPYGYALLEVATDGIARVTLDYSGGVDPGIGLANVAFALEPIEAAADIHPAGCPNPLGQRAQGTTPVALLGTGDMDVANVDATTLRAAGVAPVRAAIEDVATPYAGQLNGDRHDCTSAGPDGHPDLVGHFETQALLEALGGETLHRGDVVLVHVTAVTLDGDELVALDQGWIR